MKPAPFSYRRANELAEALEFLSQLGEDAKILAGGQSLVPMMNFRIARPEVVVDINPIAELDVLRRDGETLVVGALARHRTVEMTRDAGVKNGYDILPRTASLIGHRPIRERGTFGGSIAHADAVSEWCLLAVALDAEMHVSNASGSRRIAAADFFLGFLTTALEPDEMLTAVVFPRPAPLSAVAEFNRRAGDFATVGVAVALDLEDGRCIAGRIALGGVDSTPVRCQAAEDLLQGCEVGPDLFAAAADAAARAVSPGHDQHASAGQRRRLVRYLTGRALGEAVRCAA